MGKSSRNILYIVFYLFNIIHKITVNMEDNITNKVLMRKEWVRKVSKIVVLVMAI